jgi:hypothetical protein
MTQTRRTEITPRTDQKKRVEELYLEEARDVSTIFPDGKLEPHERPDFLIATDHGRLGIEVTELCREEPRAEAGRLSKVPEKARLLYETLPNATPVDVSIAFFRAEDVRFNVLTKSLADFVYAHRNHRGKGLERSLPRGYCHIGIHDHLETGGRWRGVRAFDTVVASKEQLAACIAAKNTNVQEYRLSAPHVWLLIVNDQFLGPGEVYACPDHLARWRFAFDFDKVLLFSREPGGSGRVIQIQRL